MAIQKSQMKELVKEILGPYGLGSKARALVLGTCAQETSMGTYLWQLGSHVNKGLGIGSIEEKTYVAAITSPKCANLPFIAELRSRDARAMVYDIRLACLAIIAVYVSKGVDVRGEVTDVKTVASLWKKHYNTSAGKGTEEQFITNWNRYVGA